MDELRQLASDQRADVLLLQEPYSVAGKVAGLPMVSKLIAAQQGNPWAAIVVLNPSLSPTKLAQFCTSHTVAIESAGFDIILVSQYYQYSDATVPCAGDLRRILAARGEREVVVGADCNGRSALWSSSEDPEPDHFKVSRGLILEDIIANYNLTVLNDSSLGSTCYIRRGATSQVDITLSTDRISRKLTDWRLLQFATKSDHAVVMVDLKLHRSELKKFQSTKSYVLSKTDWEKFT